MTKISYIIVGVAVWAGMASNAISQSPVFKKADQYFEAEAYPAAAKIYLERLETEGFDQRACERLAKCYQNTGQQEESAKWYEKAAPQTRSADVAYDYAQVLKMGGNYKKAAEMFDKFGELSQKYDEARTQAEACERAEVIKGDGKGWKVNATDLNTPESDFGPVFRGNELVFVSARKRGFFTRILNLRNNNLFYDVYMAPIQGPVTFGKAKLQKGELKTRFHDGPVVFSRDMNTAMLTRSNIKRGKLQRDAQKRAHLQLFSATLSKKKYKNAVLLPFNGDAYSTGHPALAPDGKTMVFASEIAGGQGGSDLYITKLENGGWTTPQNLGAEINSPGDELFPFITSTGMLWFASNGHPGLGGLDIFYSSSDAKGRWANVKNPGGPLNSARDDFSICFDNRGQGYFASNRQGGKGDDDIYHFQRIIPLEIIVVNQETGEPVQGVGVRMLSSSGTESLLNTDAQGKATSYLDWGKSYKFEGGKEGYRAGTAQLDGTADQSVGGREVRLSLYKYPTVTIDGSASAEKNNQPISDANVRLVGEQREKAFVSDLKGKFGGAADTASIYTAIVQKTGYMPAIQEFETYGAKGDLIVPVWVSLREGGSVLVEGTVVDKSTGAALPQTHIRAISPENEVVSGPNKSRKDGKFWLVIDRTKTADLLASRDGYFSARVSMPDNKLLKADSVAFVTVEMVPAKVGELVKIIYYDYRESILTPKAKGNLDEIVYFLLDNPAAVVELSAHTDSRGSDEFNSTLSEARAKAAVDYVISRGVGVDRIKAKGYGRSQLANDCVEGKECTDAQHGENRRTEIRVTAIK
jgi:outer membrane protein OmpA-like peptidoglycan-associated protein/tetratricopeptide (TPR) repeat protein